MQQIPKKVLDIVVREVIIYGWIPLTKESIVKEYVTMSSILPKGEDIRRAVKWISEQLQENPDQAVQQLVNKAILHFNLSPKDAEFLINFYSSQK
jgi:hypothetical protein